MRSGSGSARKPVFRSPTPRSSRCWRAHPCSLADEVRSIVNKQGRLYTESLFSAVMEAGFDLHAMPLVMLGGGACIVNRHVSPKDGLCRVIPLLDDRVNAIGFERTLGRVQGTVSEG